MKSTRRAYCSNLCIFFFTLWSSSWIVSADVSSNFIFLVHHVGNLYYYIYIFFFFLQFNFYSIQFFLLFTFCSDSLSTIVRCESSHWPFQITHWDVLIWSIPTFKECLPFFFVRRSKMTFEYFLIMCYYLLFNFV